MHNSLVPPATFEALERRVLFTAGTLDSSFGQAGVAYLDSYVPVELHTLAAAALPAGQTLMLGVPGYGSKLSFALTRLNADGSTDTTFADHGVFRETQAFSRNHNVDAFTPTCLAVDAARRIYVGGDDANFGAAVLRLNADLSVDRAYGTYGQAFTPLTGLNALALKKDGSIIAGGYLGGFRDRRTFALARIDSHGTLDANFGGSGVGATQTLFRRGGHRATSEVFALAIQRDGRIVAAGGGTGLFEIARFRADGAPDKSFGDGGTAQLPSAATRTYPAGDQNYEGVLPATAFAALAIRASDGAILAAGGTAPTDANDNAAGPLELAAFRADGSLAHAFGRRGVATLASTDATARLAAGGVALLDDGDVLVSGSVDQANARGAFLARFTPDGTPDTSYGDGTGPGALPGVAASRFAAAQGSQYSPEHVFATGLIPTTDGRFVVPLDLGTNAFPTPQLSALGVASDGSLDQAFGRRGVATVVQAERGSSVPMRVTVAPDGTVRASEQPDYAGAPSVATLTAAGAVVPAGVVASSPLLGLTAAVVAVEPDGTTFVQAQPRRGTGVDLYRLHADGSIDTTFAEGGRYYFSTASFAATTSLEVDDVLVRADGSIIADVTAGTGGTYSYNADVLFALDAQGVLRGSYALPVFSFFIVHSLYGGMALTADGDVLVGSADLLPPTPPSIAPTAQSLLVRLHGDDLSPDASFGNAGSIPLGNLGVTDHVFALPDGRILLSDSSRSGRLTADGALDPTFGTNGVAPRASGGAVLVASDGTLLVAGASPDAPFAPVVTRYHADGSLDASFGTGGQLTNDAGTLDASQGDPALALQETADGEKLLVAASVKPRRLSALHTSTTVYVGFVARVNL